MWGNNMNQNRDVREENYKSNVSFWKIGIINVLNTVWISYVLSYFVQTNISYLCGCILSICISFFINGFVWGDRKRFPVEFIEFSASNIFVLLVENGVVILLYNIIDLNKLLAYLIGAAIGLPLIYILLKRHFWLRKKNLFDKINLEEWLNSHMFFVYLVVLSFYVLLISLSNWSILLGENIMRWDIWDAEYPNQVMMTDALEGNTIPLWNPLMQYGVPYYSIVGSPVWYPITLLLAKVGYTPITLAFSYILHVAIGGGGLFLLAIEELRQKKNNITFSGVVASVIAGILYSGCGVFLSNAEHIMIVISAAWIPYVFYFTRKFIDKKKTIYIMLGGFCGGMIMLGGYPEMFYNMFLFLFLYVLLYIFKKNGRFIDSIKESGIIFALICILTILESAITLFPFLNNMGLITRGTGLGQFVNTYPRISLISALFSAKPLYMTNVEWSMTNYYFGLIVILLIPMIIKGVKEKKIYAFLLPIAFMLCLGSKSFLHTLLYRFLPMYEDFRFPTLNRTFLIIFILLLSVKTIQDVIEGKIDSKILYFDRILLYLVVAIAIIFGFLGFLVNETSTTMNIDVCKAFSDSAFTSGGLILLYFGLFYAIKHKELKGKKQVGGGLFLIVCLEVLTFAYADGALTITEYCPEHYTNSQWVKEIIDAEFEENANRVRSINFAGNKRSTSGLDSKSIVFNKTFDEEGYLSYILNSTTTFKSTYMRSIMEENPEIYFTNDIVDKNDTIYEEWVNSCANRPEQIYVEDKGEIENIDDAHRFYPEVVREEELDLLTEEGILIISGEMGAEEELTGRIRLYFEQNILPDKMYINLSFIESEGSVTDYEGEYIVIQHKGERYVDIYFPDINKNYQKVQINFADEKPVFARLVVTERMTEDGNVNVSLFSFNDIKMSVEAPTEGYVVVLQAKHDGWEAYVDDKEVEISLINNCFMGIRLDSGSHDIVMKFRPKDFLVGGVFSIIYISILAILSCIYFYKKYSTANGET